MRGISLPLSSLHAGADSCKGSKASRPTFSAAKVDTTTEAYRRLAHELTLLSPEEFGRRLYGFSRTNFDPTHTAAVHAHVSELLRRRVQEVSAKCVREYAHLAHVAGLYRLCLEVYYARSGFKSTVSSAENGVGAAGGFAVSDAIVDSAYGLASTADLIRLASFCVRHLQHVPSHGWEVMSAFSLVRAFWRCVCIALNCDTTQTTEAKQALQDAAYIYDEYMALVYPDSCRGLSTQDALRTVQRFVQYASCGDEGEMLFFRFCLQRGFLRRPRDAAKGNTGDNTLGPGNGGGDEMGRISEEQWFYASLIATCRVGHHVDVALRYFDDIGAFLGVVQVSCDDLLRPRARSVQQWNDANEPINSTASKSPGSMEVISEFLIFQLLNVLQTAKENGRIVFTARAMLGSGAKLGISVWSIVLIAAGELRAVDLALAAFTQARDALASGGHVVDRRGNEYLLQTAIHALSKCQVPRFEEDYLRPSQEQQLMHCTSELHFCVLLQHAHNSMDPAVGAEEVLREMERTGTPLTTRIVSRLMKIYLRTESPKMLDLYRHATQVLGTFKSSWLDELLLWADRRRYNLTSEERKFILDEVQRVSGAKGLQGDLGGLRTQYALLRYDYEHNPREVFSRTLVPPRTEPTVLDSRAHFLQKKPHCVVHNTVAMTNLKPVADYSIVGDPDTRRRFFRSALLTHDNTGTQHGELREDEFRAYMGKILQTLQQNNNGYL